MPLARLDHVNLRTANLAAMEAFYVEALGMTPGPRPPFAFSGTWLYCGGQATVHLVEVPVKPAPAQPRSEEHTSELQSLMRISYAVFCLKKKKTKLVH